MNRIRRFIRHHIQHRYWMILQPANAESEFHIVPNRDTVAHEAHDCPCGVTTEPIMRADGSNGWLIVHYSLDGREALERA